jgi:hypothetical protein
MWVLGANFEWKRQPRTSNNDVHKREDPRIKTLGRIQLEMTLRKSNAKSLNGGFNGFSNDIYFREEAFQPRSFIIDIQRGDFIADSEGTRVWSEKEDRERRRGGSNWYERCRLRLRFNRSPYPSRGNTMAKGPFGGSHEACLDLERHAHAVANKFINLGAHDDGGKQGCTMS